MDKQRGGAATATQAPVLSARNLTKSYGLVHALRDVSFDLWGGEVVGLVGDNGAGKSTLVSILAGANSPSDGTVLLRGEPFASGHPSRARAAGIEVVYQDLALGLDLDVSDNIFVGREICRGGPLTKWMGLLDRKAMRRKSSELLGDLSVKVPSLRRPVRQFSGGQRQGVAVARAVAWASSVLLLDEPTAALGVEQQHTVASMVTRAARNDIGVLLVSHNLPQVIELCDRVLVLYQGRLVANLTAGELRPEVLLKWITGMGEGSQ